MVKVQGKTRFVCTRVGNKLVWRSRPVSSTTISFGSGTKVVGRGLKPGIYLTSNSTSFCYWARLSGFGGTMGEVIANDISGSRQVVVEIFSTDKGFESSGCGIWKLQATPTTTSTTSTTAVSVPSIPTTTTTTPAPSGVGGFGSGTKIVGTGVKPGRYLTITASSACYWERMAGFGGSLADIIANNFSSGAHIVVEISASDSGFKSSGCGTWLPYVAKSQPTIKDGFWVVNDEIAPGLWQASKSDGCYWARLSGFGGDFEEIIANDYGSGLVQIGTTDIGFASSNCGTWTKVG